MRENSDRGRTNRHAAGVGGLLHDLRAVRNCLSRVAGGCDAPGDPTPMPGDSGFCSGEVRKRRKPHRCVTRLEVFRGERYLAAALAGSAPLRSHHHVGGPRLPRPEAQPQLALGAGIAKDPRFDGGADGRIVVRTVDPFVADLSNINVAILVVRLDVHAQAEGVVANHAPG